MNPSRPNHRCWVLVVVLACVPAVGCGITGGSGSCVSHVSGTSSSWDSCCDGKSQADCTNFSSTTATFHGGATCSSLGYTLRCSSDSQGCYRFPAFAPCP